MNTNGHPGDEPAGDSGAGGVLGAFDWLLRNLALWIGGALIFIMVGLTFAHVVLRYMFANPIHGFVDLGQIMLVFVVAFTIGYSGRTGGQIAVEIIDGFVSPSTMRILEIVTRLMGAVMLSILTFRLLQDGPEALENGESTTTLGVSYEPFFYVLGAGMALYGIVLVLEAFRLMRGQDIGQEQARLFRGDNDGAL